MIIDWKIKIIKLIDGITINDLPYKTRMQDVNTSN